MSDMIDVSEVLKVANQVVSLEDAINMKEEERREKLIEAHAELEKHFDKETIRGIIAFALVQDDKVFGLDKYWFLKTWYKDEVNFIGNPIVFGSNFRKIRKEFVNTGKLSEKLMPMSQEVKDLVFSYVLWLITSKLPLPEFELIAAIYLYTHMD